MELTLRLARVLGLGWRGCWRLARVARAVDAGPFAQALVGPCRMVLDTRDMPQLEMLLGTYEPELMALLRGALRPGDTYLDVGAQLGYTAAVAAGCVGP